MFRTAHAEMGVQVGTAQIKVYNNGSPATLGKCKAQI